MEDCPVTGYLIEVDGVPIGHEAVFEAAKARAIAAANGISSMKITSPGNGHKPGDGANVSVPGMAWYWDYDVESWIEASNPAACDPKRKGE